MGRRVLIVGTIGDAHISTVIRSLIDLGASVALIDSSSTKFTISINSNRTDCFIETGGLGAVDSVWWRLKPSVPSLEETRVKQSYGEFSEREWSSALRGLPAFLTDAFWVNRLDAQTQINNKPHQLALAKKVGLLVPDTAITNDVSTVNELFSRHKRVVYKPLSWHLFPGPSMTYTTEIDSGDIGNFGDEVDVAPGIYQELISKAFELRVTIVGTSIFSIKISTPRRGAASIDWRHAQFEDIFSPCEIPDATASALLDFHQTSNLVFATYDLIVGNDGTIYFLECNPSGQWLWLEERTGLGISKALAKTLNSPGL